MYDLERFGLGLQIFGLLVIFGSQFWLWYRARMKYGSLKRALEALTRPRERWDYEAAMVLSENQPKTLRLVPLAKFLYDDLVISVIGVVLALIGTVLELLG